MLAFKQFLHAYITEWHCPDSASELHSRWDGPNNTGATYITNEKVRPGL